MPTSSRSCSRWVAANLPGAIREPHIARSRRRSTCGGGAPMRTWRMTTSPAMRSPVWSSGVWMRLRSASRRCWLMAVTPMVSGLGKLVAEHPLRERLVALWMVALHRCGRRAEALAAYDAARKRLAGELGIEPGERLQRLYAAMLEPVEADRRPLELLAPRRRRSARLLLAEVGTLLIAAAVAALMVSRSHTTGGIDVVAGDHVALIDPISQRVVAEYPVGQTPSDVVARGAVAWTINADSQTLSRIQRDGTRRDVALPGIPGGVVWNAGWIWVSYIVP